MPNDRIVRSSTSPRVGVDGERLGEHPPERHVRGTDAVGAQHDLVERIAGGDADVDALDRARRRIDRHSGARQRRRPAPARTCRAAPTPRARRPRSRPARPPPRRARPRAARPARPSRPRAARRSSAGPARRRAPTGPARAPGTARAARGGTARCCPPTRPSRWTHVRRRAPRSRPIGGRFGPRRTTSSREYTTRTVRPRRSASSRAAAGARDAAFPPNAPPLASGVAGSPPGTHHDASGSRYAGSTQLVASRTPPGTAGGAVSGGRVDCGRAPALHLARGRPRLVERVGHDPEQSRGLDARRGRAGRAGDGHERVARRGVVGEPAVAERHVAAPTCWATPPSSAARRRAAVEVAAHEGQGCQPRGRARSPRTPSAIRCTGRGARRGARSRSVRVARPLPRSAAARTTMPGVQNPHCEPPVATNARTSDSRSAGSSPSTVVTCRSATRAAGRDARHAWIAVDQHGAAPALALRRAAVLHRRQPEVLPQHGQQRGTRRHVHLDRLAVAREREQLPIRDLHGRTAG